jgi:hypothetical protein
VRAELAALVRTLAVTIGPRSYKDPTNLNAAADFISQRLESFGYEARSRRSRIGSEN